MLKMKRSFKVNFVAITSATLLIEIFSKTITLQQKSDEIAADWFGHLASDSCLC